MDLSQIASFWGVPVAVTGFFFWLLKQYLVKRDKEKEAKTLEREKQRETLILMLMQSVRATTVLGEATARAVQRIPDAKCNGDMTKALEFVKEVQVKQKDFLMSLGVHSIYDEQ